MKNLNRGYPPILHTPPHLISTENYYNLQKHERKLPMNLNFRKFKSSLLSLGLSATLFCTAGLAGLPVFAEGPATMDEWREAILRIQAGMPEYSARGKEAETRTYTLLHNQLAVSRQALANGVKPPLRPVEGGFTIHLSAFARYTGITERQVERQLVRGGAHLAGRGDGYWSWYTLVSVDDCAGRAEGDIVEATPVPPIVDDRGQLEVQVIEKYKKLEPNLALRKTARGENHRQWLRDLITISEETFEHGRPDLATVVLLGDGTSLAVNAGALKRWTGTCKSATNYRLKAEGLHKGSFADAGELDARFGRPLDLADRRHWEVWTPTPPAAIDCSGEELLKNPAEPTDQERLSTSPLHTDNPWLTRAFTAANWSRRPGEQPAIARGTDGKTLWVRVEELSRKLDTTDLDVMRNLENLGYRLTGTKQCRLATGEEVALTIWAQR
jgi:hypothetical protein